MTAMRFSDETVMAYVDGELDESIRAAVDAALPTDPDLFERITLQRMLRDRLHQEFDPVLTEQIPQRLLAAAQGSPVRARAADVIPLRQTAPARWSWPLWGAIAASFVIGVVVAPLLWRPSTEAPLVIRDGQLRATGSLARALSEQLASNQAADAPAHIGISFLASDGNYCRTFLLRGKNALAGLACYADGGWQLRATSVADHLSSAWGGYQTATSSMPPEIAQAVSQSIVGDPLDASAEAGARANGWHR